VCTERSEVKFKKTSSQPRGPQKAVHKKPRVSEFPEAKRKRREQRKPDKLSRLKERLKKKEERAMECRASEGRSREEVKEKKIRRLKCLSSRREDSKIRHQRKKRRDKSKRLKDPNRLKTGSSSPPPPAAEDPPLRRLKVLSKKDRPPQTQTFPSKLKHRERPRRAQKSTQCKLPVDHTANSYTTVSTVGISLPSPRLSCSKLSEEGCSSPKPPTDPAPTNTAPKKTAPITAKPSLPAPSQGRREANLLSALPDQPPAPSSTGHSEGLLQAKPPAQRCSGVLKAPDLQPAAGLGVVLELGQSPAASPPVLSWQGSPVSSLGEDEDDLEQGVLIGPVLQTSPTHSCAVSHGDAEEECEDGLGRRRKRAAVAAGDSDDDDDDDDEMVKGCQGNMDGVKPQIPGTGVAEEEGVGKKGKQVDGQKDGEEENGDKDRDKDGEKDDETDASDSLLLRRLHAHQNGLDDVFKSLATFLGGQSVMCRGGPFGRVPASTLGPVKSSSSLALGPQIHCTDQQDSLPHHPKAPGTRTGQSQGLATSDVPSSHSRPVRDARQREKPTTESVSQKCDVLEIAVKDGGSDIAGDLLGRPASSGGAGALSAELRLTTTTTTTTSSTTTSTNSTTTHASCLTADLLTVPAKVDTGSRDGAAHSRSDRKRKQIAGDDRRIGGGGVKVRRSDVIGKQEAVDALQETTVDGAIGNRSDRNTAPASPPLQGPSGGPCSQRSQEKHNSSIQITEAHTRDQGTSDQMTQPVEKMPFSTYSADAVASGSTASNPSTASTALPPCSPGGCVDAYKMKALSMGLFKELKIHLIKVEKRGVDTFITSELEERRIPMSKISIRNTASEVVRACK